MLQNEERYMEAIYYKYSCGVLWLLLRICLRRNHAEGWWTRRKSYWDSRMSSTGVRDRNVLPLWILWQFYSTEMRQGIQRDNRANPANKFCRSNWWQPG